jgi:hypothetical protein
MTADSEDRGIPTYADRGIEALEDACKEDHGGRGDSDGLGLVDANYTAIWLASAIPQLRELLPANPALGDDLAIAILGNLSSLSKEETPDYGWRFVRESSPRRSASLKRPMKGGRRCPRPWPETTLIRGDSHGR